MFAASLVEQAQVYYRSRTNRSAFQSGHWSTSRKHDNSTVYIGSFTVSFSLAITTHSRFPLALVSFLLGSMLLPPALFSAQCRQEHVHGIDSTKPTSPRQHLASHHVDTIILE